MDRGTKSLGMEYIYMEIYYFLGFNCISTRLHTSLEEQFPGKYNNPIYARESRAILHQRRITGYRGAVAEEKDGGEIR